MLDVDPNGLDIRIVSVVQHLSVAIDAIEFFVKPVTRDLLVKRRRLLQQVFARFIANHVFAGLRVLNGNSANDKFLVQAVATFFEITTISHLCDEISRPDEVAAYDVTRVVQFDFVEVQFVTRKVHDHAGDADIFRHAKLG